LFRGLSLSAAIVLIMALLASGYVSGAHGGVSKSFAICQIASEFKGAATSLRCKMAV
jgi:hypothetical protein